MEVFQNCQNRTKKLRRCASMEWKSTDTKMYLVCDCGASHCYRGYFAQFLRCDKCEQVYFVNVNVEVVPLKPEEVDHMLHTPLDPS